MSAVAVTLKKTSLEALIIDSKEIRQYWKLAIIFIFSFPSLSIAAEKEVRFEDTAQVGKDKLVLNGTGVRTATIFKAKVYAASFYLKSKTAEAAAALNAPYPKQIQMFFFRELGGEDLKKAWDHSFPENCEVACDNQGESLAKLKTLMSTVKEGDRMTYTFFETKVEVAFNGEKKGEVLSSTFPRNLLATWIGKAPPTEVLRRGLLGQSN